MKIVKLESFNNKLKSILKFIALDSKTNAKQFKNDLVGKIKSLVNMPYKCRQSIYFEDENIRDLVFKGYVVVYKVDIKNNRVIIIGINKYMSKL